MEKTITFENYGDSNGFTVSVTIDHPEDETPVRIEVPAETKWYSMEDAKALVKTINAALKELK